MTDKKLTDNEIIKALEEEIEYGCGHYIEIEMSTIKDTFDLINRLQAENERLWSMNQAKLDTIHDLQEENNWYNETINTTKAEAYKEFADKIEERISIKILKGKSNEYAEGFADALDGVNGEIDNLLKELVGEDNADR